MGEGGSEGAKAGALQKVREGERERMEAGSLGRAPSMRAPELKDSGL